MSWFEENAPRAGRSWFDENAPGAVPRMEASAAAVVQERRGGVLRAIAEPFRRLGEAVIGSVDPATGRSSTAIGEVFWPLVDERARTARARAPWEAPPIIDVGALRLQDLLPESWKAHRGAAAGVQDVATSFTTPLNVLLLAGTGGVTSLLRTPAARSAAQRLMSAGFSADMLHTALERAPEFTAQVEAGDTEGAARTLTNIAGSGAFAALAARHALAPEPVRLPAADKPAEPTPREARELERRERMIEEQKAAQARLANPGSWFAENVPERTNREQRRATVQIPETATVDNPDLAPEAMQAPQVLVDPRLREIAAELGLGEWERLTEADKAVIRRMRDEGWTAGSQRAADSEPPAGEPSSEPQPPAARPVTTPRPPATPPVYGRETEVLVPGERKKYQAVYALREADDVHASHNAVTFERNPQYEYVNDRNYTEPQNAERIVKQVAEFDPEYLVNDNPTAENGPPIIDSRGNVLGGNSRTMTLERVEQSRPEAAESYRQRIIEQAKKFGISPDLAQRMKRPRLVRELVEELPDPQAAITDFNKVGTAELRLAERAIADSRRVTPETLERITRRIEDQGPEGTLAQALDGDARDIVERLVADGVVTTQEKPRLLNGDGRLTQEGKQRVTRLLTGRLFEDARQFDEAAPELKAKLERIVAPLARVEGREGWDITEATREAVKLAEEARRRDQSIDDLIAQRGLFGEHRYSDEAVAIARKLQEKPTSVAKSFRQYAAEAEMGAHGQGLLGMEPPTPAESFQAAFGASETGPVTARFGKRRVAEVGGWQLPEVSLDAGGRENPARLAGNRLATLLLNDVLGIDFLGASLTQSQLRGIMGRLDSAVKGHGRQNWAFAWTKRDILRVRHAFEQAASTGKDVIYHSTEGSVHDVEAIRRHEELHAAQKELGRRIGEEKTDEGHIDPEWLLHDRLAGKAAESLVWKGYSRDKHELAAEIGAHLAEGPAGWKYMGLDVREAERLRRLYRRALIMAHGYQRVYRITGFSPILESFYDKHSQVYEGRGRIDAEAEPGARPGSARRPPEPGFPPADTRGDVATKRSAQVQREGSGERSGRNREGLPGEAAPGETGLGAARDADRPAGPERARSPEANPPRAEGPPQAAVAEPPQTLTNTLERIEAEARARISQRWQDAGTTLSAGPGLAAEQLADYAIVGAAKIAKGAIRFGQWSAEMITEFGEEIRPYLGKIWMRAKRLAQEQAGDGGAARRPAATTSTPPVERPVTSPSYERTKPKILEHVSDPVREMMERRLADFEARNPERRKVGFEEIVEEARALDPKIVAALDMQKLRAGDTLRPEVRLAARETLLQIEKEIAAKDEALRQDPAPEAKQRLLEQREALDRDARRLIDVLIPTRSQDGRNLAYHRIMAEGSFDATYWLARARRAMALPEGADLPEEVAASIREITRRGQAAEDAAVERAQRGRAGREAAGIDNGGQAGPRRRRDRRTVDEEGRSSPTQEERLAHAKELELERIQRQMDGQTAERRPSKWELTPEERRMVDADPEVREARIALARKLAELERTGWMDAVIAFRRAGLLTGPRTHMRNLTGNLAFQAIEEVSRAPAAVIDAALSVFSGRRAVLGPNLRDVSSAGYQAATRGIVEARQILREGATENQLAQLDLVKEIHTGSKAFDAAVNAVFRTMSAEDRLFKVYAFERSLREQMRLAGVTEPTEGMRVKAWEDAAYATFNNTNPASEAWSSAKARLRSSGAAGMTLAYSMDLAVPFARTPSNIVARVIDYTPVGAAARAGHAVYRAMRQRGWTPDTQRAFSLAIGRGVTGSALLWMGYWLAKQGLMTGVPEDSAGRRDVADAAGRMYGSIRVGDTWHRVDSMSPIGNLLVLGATLAQQEARKGAAGAIAAAAGRTVMEQPMLRGTKDLIEAVQSPGRAADRVAGAMAGSFVPTIVADVAALADNTRRETREATLGSAIAEGVMLRTPGLRNQLPPRLDLFGERQEQRRVSVILPTIGSPAKDATDPVIREIVQAGAEIAKRPKRKDETDEQYERRMKGEGQMIRNRLTWLFRTTRYREASPEERKELIQEQVSRARAEHTRAERRAGRQ